MKIFKLGTIITDKVTETEGMLTYLTVDLDNRVCYIYQPRGLNPETKQPVERIFIETSRISNAKTEEIDLPLHILGTQAEDIATGFVGTVTSIIYHINGCIHVELKPKGILKNTGATITACEFDIRRVKGKAITPLNSKQLKESIKDKPSPTNTIPRTQR